MLTAHQARVLISAAEARAADLGVPVNIAVLDAGAYLVAFSRMDGAILGSIDLAIRKAKTAVLFQTTSEAVWEYCKPGAPGHALEGGGRGEGSLASRGAQVSDDGGTRVGTP